MSIETYGVTAKKVVKGKKTTVVVTFPDGRQETLGGQRAERATAVVVSQYEPREGYYIPEGSLVLHVVGLRADAAKAAAEARGLLAPAAPRPSRVDRNPAPRAPAIRAAAVAIEAAVS